MFTMNNTNGQYTQTQIERMNERLLELYPLAEERDHDNYDELLQKHYSEQVLAETA